MLFAKSQVHCQPVLQVYNVAVFQTEGDQVIDGRENGCSDEFGDGQ